MSDGCQMGLADEVSKGDSGECERHAQLVGGGTLRSIRDRLYPFMVM